MSSAQMQLDSTPAVIAVDPSLTATGATRPVRGNVRDATAYRIRLPFTMICVGTGLALTLTVNPDTLQNWAWRWGVAGSGIATVLMGAAVRLCSLASIGECKTSRLVTTGPYSLCRNPLYLGTLFIVLGFLGLWQSLPLTLLVMPVILLYRNGVVPAEEEVLRQHHGEEFLSYCARTPRWLPQLSGYVAEPQPAMDSNGFQKELEASLWWVVLAALSVWFRHFAG